MFISSVFPRSVIAPLSMAVFAASAQAGAVRSDVSDEASNLEFGAIDGLSTSSFLIEQDTSHLGFVRNVGGVRLKFDAPGSGFAPLPAAARTNDTSVELSKSFRTGALSFGWSRAGAMDGYSSSEMPNAMHVGGALLLGTRLALAGRASYSLAPDGLNGGLVNGLTTGRADGFALALVASDRLRPGDRFSLSLSQPMRTYPGQELIDMLTGRHLNSDPLQPQLRFSMVPIGHEMRAQLSYRAPAGNAASLGLTFMLRRDPGNVYGRPAEKLIALRYVKSF